MFGKRGRVRLHESFNDLRVHRASTFPSHWIAFSRDEKRKEGAFFFCNGERSRDDQGHVFSNGSKILPAFFALR